MSNEDKCEPKPDVSPETKCPSKKKLYSPTIRLKISLREPDEEFCSVFNYISLINEEKRNRRREREKLGGNHTADENEEIDSEVKRLASHFEEKYGVGTTSKKKKKKKAPTFYNYSELASGYDESDSFIDNSEAFDEALPDEMETFHGGYYVNCGQLEFKKIETVDENSDVEEIKAMKKKTSLLKSDDSNNNDDSSKSEFSHSESEAEDAANETKKLPEENDQKDIDYESDRNIIESPKINDKLPIDKLKLNNTVVFSNGDVARKKKKKYKKRHLSEDTELRPKKKARTVKLLLEEKRIVENGENVNGCVGKNVETFHNSVNDVIESVVNAARNRSEDSRDSTSSSTETKSVDSRTSCETEKENHVEEMEVAESGVSDVSTTNITKEQIKLPDNLPSDVLELLTQLKQTAQNSDYGARSFFNSPVNSKLLSNLETKARSSSSACRHAAYAYLASFLPCSKDTLMKRAKKFLVEEEENRVSDLLNKLKLCIDVAMPKLIDNYLSSCQQFVDEKSINSACKNNEVDEKNSSSRLPPKKFIWTDEIRSYVKELVVYHLRCLHLLKPKKESFDEHIKKFLESKVKPLWPVGWMDTATLFAEARLNNISSKMKKISRTSNAHVVSAKKSQLPVPNSNNLSPTSVSVSTNYNLLTNSLALQSLSMQYSSQPDSVYSCAAASTTTSIPYRSDLNLISGSNSLPSQPSSTIPHHTMDILSRIAGTSNQQYPTTSTAAIPYSKSANPSKKQTTSSSSSSASSSSTSHRTSTPVVSSLPGLSALPSTSTTTSFPVEHRKNQESNSNSKFNDMFKIDSLIGAAKPKKEHHQLNHVSQYNKHYSHKVEKKKISNDKREISYISNKSPVNLLSNASNAYSNSKSNSNNNNSNSSSHNQTQNNSNAKLTNLNSISSGNNSSTISGSNKNSSTQGNSNCNGVNVGSSDLAKVTTSDQVLDLSPNKIIKVENKKPDVVHVRMEHHHKNDSSMSHTASANVTAKDHSYWSSVKEETDVKEERSDPIIVSNVSSSDTFVSSNQNGNSKPVHISRKQRILQESSKTVHQESAILSSKDGSVRPQKNNSSISNIVKNDSSVLNILSAKNVVDDRKGRSSPAVRDEKRSSLPEEKLLMEETTAATDMLSKIINDSLQEAPKSSSRSSFMNSTYESMGKKLDRDSREKDPPSNCETEIKLHLALKESQLQLPEKTYNSTTNAERKNSSMVDRCPGGQKITEDLIKDLLILNKFGGHSIPRRMEQVDASYNMYNSVGERPLENKFAAFVGDQVYGSLKNNRKM